MKFRSTSRNGTTAIELIVSGILLLTFMTFVTTLCFRTNLVWRDIGHQRIASGELSNQMEALTRLSRIEAEKKIESLVPSDVCEAMLKTPRLSGAIVEDGLGLRISLKLEWERRNPGLPVELVGWLNPSEADDAELDNAKSETKEDEE